MIFLRPIGGLGKDGPVDDGKYALSWYEPPSEEPSLAGVTSHL